MNKKKWEIKELSPSGTLSDSAKIILPARLEDLLSSIKVYFEKETPENLHSTRIAVRRLRYSMELFIECFDKKKFTGFYEKIRRIQDLTGSVRDLDVLRQNATTLCEEKKIKIPGSFILKIDEKRSASNENLKLELMKFIHSKNLKEFSRIIS